MRVDDVLTLTLVALLAVVTHPLGESFTLRVGETGEVEEAGLVLTFAQVSRDNRCPRDVQCIVAGSATVVLKAQTDGLRPSTADGEPADLEFEIPPDGSDTGRFQGYEIKIETLDPQPLSGKRIEEEDYRATVVVERP